MDWYQGPHLMGLLESLKTQEKSCELFRFEIQNSFIHDNSRWIQGQVLSGSLSKMDKIKLLPSGKIAETNQILLADKPVLKAYNQKSYSIIVEKDDLESVENENFIIKQDGILKSSQSFNITVIWWGDIDLTADANIEIQFFSKRIHVESFEIKSHWDFVKMNSINSDTIRAFYVGDACMKLSEEILYEPYGEHKDLGSFCLIQPKTNRIKGLSLINSKV